MEENHSNWTRLPAEIFHLIFQQTSADQLSRCALVCKTWLVPAQLILYSNVTVTTVPKLKKLLKTVKRNYQLRNIVRTFNQEANLKIHQDTVETNLLNVFKNLLSCLPNLEALYGTTPYAIVQDSLWDSQLRRLKRLGFPRSGLETNNYFSCASLLRNRLEKVLVMLQQPINHESQHLYNTLHQFNALTEIKIIGNFNTGIQVLEHIVEGCRSLKKIDFTFSNADSPQTTNNSEISNYVPRCNIESLEGYLQSHNENKFLLYVMHKFPGLKSLSLEFAKSNTPQLVHPVVTKMLNYVSEIDSFSLNGLSMDEFNVTKAINTSWGAQLDDSDKKVKFILSDRFIADNRAIKLDVANERSQTMKAIITTFTYRRQNFEWRLYMEFMENFGEYIYDMRFACLVENAPYTHMCDLHQGFFPRTFTFCQNLQCLHLDHCVLKYFTYSEVDFNNDISIKEFYLDYCVVYPGVLEELSKLISKVTRLRLRLNKFSKSGIEPDDLWRMSSRGLIDITMPYTEVDTILIDDSYEYFLVKDLVEGQLRYYQFDSSNPVHLQVSNENAYRTAKENKRVQICCQKNPEIEFE